MRYETPQDYFGRPDVVAEYASFDFLLEPERAILEEMGPHLAEARMLDVGVGAGRTTVHFAPRVREYVGVDVSPAMIEACRRRFARAEGDPTFVVADARDLAELETASFDFVLFSFNGLDTVGGEPDRRAALRAIHRVCRPGATFTFSSSNLAFVQARASIPGALKQLVRLRPHAVLRPRLVRKAVSESRRWRRLNPRLPDLASRGEGLVVEDRPRFEFEARHYASPRDRIRVEKYYITPRRQIDQLEEAGFGDVRVIEPDGKENRGRVETGLERWWWVHYVCNRPGDGEARTGNGRP